MEKVKINGVTYCVDFADSISSACDNCSFSNELSCPKGRIAHYFLCSEYDKDRKFAYFKRID